MCSAPLKFPDANLPVVVYIYGGGFSTGDSSLFDANTFVSRSVRLGDPVIYISFNYSLNGFGFLAGKEVKEAGVANLGIHDRECSIVENAVGLHLDLVPTVHRTDGLRQGSGTLTP